MNMDDFDKETWYLHRKLFHRFVKYAKYFRQATEVLPAYEKAHLDEQDELVKKQRAKKENKVTDLHVVSLLTSSSDEVSADEQEEKDEPKVSDGDVHM